MFHTLIKLELVAKYLWYAQYETILVTCFPFFSKQCNCSLKTNVSNNGGSAVFTNDADPLFKQEQRCWIQINDNLQFWSLHYMMLASIEVMELQVENGEGEKI